MKMLSSAIVCGRFQPFHNEHLKYILAAYGRARFLWIGITKPWQTIHHEALSHRETADANPYNYITRLRMVSQSLIECGISGDDFRIIPFDFEDPHKLSQCDPPCKDVFVTITDAWSQEKISKLENCGKTVSSLYENLNPEITGTNVRSLRESGSEAWKRLVPPAVVKILESRDEGD
jgi:nicotinamide mononucleotide adenylyltransferase